MSWIKAIAGDIWRSRVGKGVLGGAAYGMFSDQTSVVGGAFKGGVLAGLARGRAGIGGAIVGGIYGAMSNSNSILGGAAMGATLGRGIGPFAAKGLSSWNAGRGFDYGLGGAAKAAGYGLYRQGRKSAVGMGRTMTRGYNEFKTMFGK